MLLAQRVKTDEGTRIELKFSLMTSIQHKKTELPDEVKLVQLLKRLLCQQVLGLEKGNMSEIITDAKFKKVFGNDNLAKANLYSHLLELIEIEVQK